LNSHRKRRIRRLPFDPVIDQHVLAEDIQLHIAELGLLALDAVGAAPGLPEFQPLRRNVNGHGAVRENAAGGLAIAQFHHQRKLLIRTVELHMRELLEGQCVQGDVLPHAAAFHDQVNGPAVDHLGGDAVNDAGAAQTLAFFLEPQLLAPVLQLQVFQERQAVAGHIKVAPVGGGHVDIVHPQKAHRRGVRRKTTPLELAGVLGRGGRCARPPAFESQRQFRAFGSGRLPRRRGESVTV